MRQYQNQRNLRIKQNNPDKYHADKTKRAACYKAWAKTPTGRAYRRVIRQRRRARLAGSFSEGLTPSQLFAVFEATGGLCVYCKKTATGVDHVVPISRGGRDDIGNVVPCCTFCNSSKSNRLISEWPRARDMLLPQAYSLLVDHTEKTLAEAS